MAMIEITALFIGTIIGAGFATGAEIVTFFGQLPLPIWCLVILVAVALFSLLASSIFFATHPPQSKIINTIFVVCYLVLFCAMTAGVRQIAGTFCCVISLILSVLIVAVGLKDITAFNTIIVSVIILGLLVICLPHCPTKTITPSNFRALPAGLLWSFLYAGLNCFMLPEIIQSSQQRFSRKQLYFGAAITAVLIAIFVGLILQTIRVTKTADQALPLLASAPRSKTFILILFAMLTSQYAALFALVQRTKQLLPKHSTIPWALIYCLLAFSTAFIGFGRILHWGYPAIGIFICCFWLFSWLSWLWHQRRHFRH